MSDPNPSTIGSGIAIVGDGLVEDPLNDGGSVRKGLQSGFIITPDHIIHAAGTRGPTGNHPHQIFVYDRAGELLSSFYPSYPIEGDKGISQSRAVVVRRGEALLVVNAAPIEVVEYALSSGRKLRTLVPADSSLVSARGERYYFEKRQAPGVRLRRRHFPRVRYAELLENNRRTEPTYPSSGPPTARSSACISPGLTSRSS